MFTTLDTYFPERITDMILSYSPGTYLSEKGKKSKARIYFNRKDDYGELVPKPVFEISVWARRYKNPYCPEGVKLHAYNYIELPVKRIPHFFARSLDRLPRMMNQEPDFFLRIMQNLTLLCEIIENLQDVARKRFLADISVPLMILTIIENFFFPPHVERHLIGLKGQYPSLEWVRAGLYLQLFQEHDLDDRYPLRSRIWYFLGMQ